MASRSSSRMRPSRSRWRGSPPKRPCLSGHRGARRVGLRESALRARRSWRSRPPKTGSYEPPDPPNLPLVEEPMELTICVSPEAGWSELEDFLGETKKSLTVAMYQFTAPHIFDAVNAAVSPEGRQFELVLHPVPEKPAVLGRQGQRLGREIRCPRSPRARRFRIGSRWRGRRWCRKPIRMDYGPPPTTSRSRFATDNAAWVSSGNWQSSNQPNVHPFESGAEAAVGLPAQVQSRLPRDHQQRTHRLDLRTIYQARSRPRRGAGGRAELLRGAGPVRARRGGSARAFRCAAAASSSLCVSIAR